MFEAIDPFLNIILLLNFYMLGASRLRTLVQGVALQGAVLGVLLVMVHGGPTLRTVAFASATILIKAVLIPLMLTRAMRESAIRREVEPLIGFIPTLLFGALATGLAIVFARTLPLAPQHAKSLLLPTSFSTVLAGFLILTTRKKAITQVVGYLMLENGIFIMGLSLLEAMPALVEIGVLLDLLVGIFVLGIIINHISREFSSLDTGRLSTLKE
jgi:hydrogenase-4 component E